MRLIDYIISGDYSNIKSIVEQRFSEIVSEKMKVLKEEARKEFMSEDNLLEATEITTLLKWVEYKRFAAELEEMPKDVLLFRETASVQVLKVIEFQVIP